MTRDQHFYATRHFSNTSKEKLREYAEQTHQKQRSPELKKAWAEQQIIKEKYAVNIPVRIIASEYKVPVRAVYRIISRGDM